MQKHQFISFEYCVNRISVEYVISIFIQFRSEQLRPRSSYYWTEIMLTIQWRDIFGFIYILAGEIDWVLLNFNYFYFNFVHTINSAIGAHFV